jgi:hypothetical protein
MNNFDPINKALNISDTPISIESCEKGAIKDISLVNNLVMDSDLKIDIKKDYEYTRANLYSLVEKGQEAINGILELAGEGGSPRAYEVAGQLIKSVGDVTDKLMDLQKKVKDMEEDSSKSSSNVTNNAVFIGSTSELSKILKQGFLNNNDKI